MLLFVKVDERSWIFNDNTISLDDKVSVKNFANLQMESTFLYISFDLLFDILNSF